MRSLGFVSTFEAVPWGGSELLWSQAALKLRADGVAVSANVLGWKPRPKQIEELIKAGIAVTERLPPHSLAHRSIRKFGMSYERNWLRATRPDAVVISTPDSLSIDTWAGPCRDLGIPYVTISQAGSEWLWPDDDRAGRLYELLTGAAACFYVSASNLQLMRVQLAADLPNAFVVRNPFNVPYNDPPPWPSAPHGELRLACVGRLCPAAKGQDLIIGALADTRWRDRAITVSFFGTGPCEQTLQRLAQQLKVTAVRFPGHVADIRKIWAEQHALILPSRAEGLPLVIVEAALSERPSIVSNIAGNAELVRDGIDGFVAPIPSIESVSEALERCWNNRDGLREMGRRAAEHVRSAVPADPAREFVHLIRQALNA